MKPPLNSSSPQKTSATGAPEIAEPDTSMFRLNTHMGAISRPITQGTGPLPRRDTRITETDRAKKIEPQGAEEDTLHHGNRRGTTEPQIGSVQQRCN